MIGKKKAKTKNIHYPVHVDNQQPTFPNSKIIPILRDRLKAVWKENFSPSGE